jgi:hypothetical protein
MESTRPSFTLTEAARATGKSRVTLRRRLDAGRFPTAFRDEESGAIPAPWRIPREDLIRAGLTLRSIETCTEAVGATVEGTHPVSDEALSVLVQTAAVARAIADERARTIETLEGVISDLRALLSGVLTHSARTDRGG